MALNAAQPALSYANIREPLRALIVQGQYKQALSHLIQMPSTEVEWLDDAATCYFRLGDSETAMKLTEMIVQTMPGSELGWNKLGAMALSVGDRKRAEQAFNRVLKMNPKSVKTLASLNRIKTFSRNSSRTKTLRRLASAKDIPTDDRANAWNALGRIEEASGSYASAFRCFAKCKTLSAVPHERDLFDQHIAAQIAQFDGTRDSLPSIGARVIFVVGMPRSGTTLVESILCRHPSVDSIGESPELMQSLARMRVSLQKTHGGDSDWDWYHQASVADLAAARDRYLEKAWASFPGNAPEVIVDKLPLNCLEMGFARLILPEARFVFMDRYPLDVGLSNFSTHFAAPQPFSHRLEDMGHMINVVQRSADHFAPLLGGSFRKQSYRALVESPEPQIRALLEHVDLPFDAACLSPEDRKDAVRTASVTQVRAPINTKALAKWRRYEAELAPLIDALGGPDWLNRWETADARA